MTGTEVLQDGASIVKGACHHDCPDTCAWEVTVEDGHAVQLRGVADHPFTAGDTVRVFNDRGSVEMRAAVVDRVQPGLVTMPFGWWANATSGGRGANALSNPSLGRKIGSASFHDTLVQVEKAGS
jgi:anaerobic selenocysteine-containing dehydrogenase